ncbi:SDR family NAD(P)-dependent oxidoreductase, partial [uncultured Amaricoccus sp.]|uniref:SDR family NAD(P)-dependent oxidoreductase n=1 Tax=uncultured Amaricoccus sp. TaxID=339341 RepID=UPI00260EF87D
MISERRFAGRRAVVTGGASGIGRAVAGRLAAEGARVAVWDRDAAGAEAVAAELEGGMPVPVDITDWSAVEAAAARTAEAFGGIDVLV